MEPGRTWVQSTRRIAAAVAIILVVGFGVVCLARRIAPGTGGLPLMPINVYSDGPKQRMKEFLDQSEDLKEIERKLQEQATADAADQ